MGTSRSFRHTLATFAHRGAIQGLAGQFLSVAAVLLFSAGLLFGLNFYNLRQQFEAEHAADRAIEQLYRVENHLLATELSVRGYALSADGIFLTYYRMELDKLATAMKPLPDTVAAVPAHRDQVKRLLTKVNARVDSLAKLMNAARGNSAEVGRAIVDPSVRNTMRGARAAITSMREMEWARRGRLTEEAERTTNRNNLLAGGILILSFIFGVAGFSFALFGGPPSDR
jgi:CHASE3 domain sensor protein